MLQRLHLSTKILTSEIIFLVLAANLLGIMHYPRLVPLNVNLFLHILGAVLFIGNIIVTGVWMYLAERSKDRAVITFAAKAVNWMDVFFTGPGVILLLLNGLEMAPYCDQCHQGFATKWIQVGLGLFIVSGILWVALIIYQNALVRGLTENNDQFYKTLHKWYVIGVADTIIPLIILAVMIIKPAF